MKQNETNTQKPTLYGFSLTIHFAETVLVIEGTFVIHLFYIKNHMGYHMILAENSKNLVRNHMVPRMNIFKIHHILLKIHMVPSMNFWKVSTILLKNSYGTP